MVLCEPKHVRAAFIICVHYLDNKVFDIIDAQCNMKFILNITLLCTELIHGSLKFQCLCKPTTVTYSVLVSICPTKQSLCLSFFLNTTIPCLWHSVTTTWQKWATEEAQYDLWLYGLAYSILVSTELTYLFLRVDLIDDLPSSRVTDSNVLLLMPSDAERQRPRACCKSRS